MSTSDTITTASTSYRSLKLGKAYKIGARAVGCIHYRVLTDAQHQQLYLVLVGNDSAGCYSREIVSFERIERCLVGIDTTQPIASKVFRPAFVSQSQNNAGFLATVLRAEHLLGPTPDANYQHQVLPDWNDWKQQQFAQVSTAEAFEPDFPKPRGAAVKAEKSEKSEKFESALSVSVTDDIEGTLALNQNELSIHDDNPLFDSSESVIVDHPVNQRHLSGKRSSRERGRQP